MPAGRAACGVRRATERLGSHGSAGRNAPSGIFRSLSNLTEQADRLTGRQLLQAKEMSEMYNLGAEAAKAQISREQYRHQPREVEKLGSGGSNWPRIWRGWTSDAVHGRGLASATLCLVQLRGGARRMQQNELGMRLKLRGWIKRGMGSTRRCEATVTAAMGGYGNRCARRRRRHRGKPGLASALDRVELQARWRRMQATARNQGRRDNKAKANKASEPVGRQGQQGQGARVKASRAEAGRQSSVGVVVEGGEREGGRPARGALMIRQ